MRHLLEERLHIHKHEPFFLVVVYRVHVIFNCCNVSINFSLLLQIDSIIGMFCQLSASSFLVSACMTIKVYRISEFDSFEI